MCPAGFTQHQWFSGKIQRCHRWAPSSILGWCTLVLAFCHRSTDAKYPLSEIQAITVVMTNVSTAIIHSFPTTKEYQIPLHSFLVLKPCSFYVV